MKSLEIIKGIENNKYTLPKVSVNNVKVKNNTTNYPNKLDSNRLYKTKTLY